MCCPLKTQEKARSHLGTHLGPPTCEAVLNVLVGPCWTLTRGIIFQTPPGQNMVPRSQAMCQAHWGRLGTSQDLARTGFPHTETEPHPVCPPCVQHWARSTCPTPGRVPGRGSGAAALRVVASLLEHTCTHAHATRRRWWGVRAPALF